ncbi:MAG: hypothetical protein IPJ32_20925 [Sphingobacteriaceae bacterium]|nr:hypothetical protein [Sphingobacteriaceae bacterium]
MQTLKNTPPKPRNDINAISLSVQQGVKGMRSKGQGNGMWGMYKIVQENSGHLTIISGRGGIYFKDNATNNFKDIVFLSKKNKGTFISFNLNLNKETLLTNAIPGFTFPNLYIENLENETGESYIPFVNLKVEQVLVNRVSI